MDSNATPDSDAEKQTILNDGTSFRNGTIGELTWQASGVLQRGCPVPAVSITNAYHLFFTADPTQQLDTHHLDSPRQRNEFHFPPVFAGTPFAYTWKHYLYESTGTGSDTWFHLMQAFGVAENGPLVTLDAENGVLRIKDYVRGSTGCPRTKLEEYHGKTTTHHVSGKFGPEGSLSYKITNEDGDTILSYAVDGEMGAGAG
ncbi:DOMON domain-containing protein [Mycena sanguinolenta]|uniref:DOMON domain-containing protein n=1 Tax=Mycena sanguinolenta TaxID=230812 RepID=A0A8H6ZFU7_9AGAR|nr:DOMON domain-containing protein [Mycena sanguinolenta]